MCSVPHCLHHSLRHSFSSGKSQALPKVLCPCPELPESNPTSKECISLQREAQKSIRLQLPGDSDEWTGLEFTGLETISGFFQLKNLMYPGIKFHRPLSKHWTGNAPDVCMLRGHWDMGLKAWKHHHAALVTWLIILSVISVAWWFGDLLQVQIRGKIQGSTSIHLTCDCWMTDAGLLHSH